MTRKLPCKVLLSAQGGSRGNLVAMPRPRRPIALPRRLGSAIVAREHAR